eukprot:6482459-Amphidinium_carterae.2
MNEFNGAIGIAPDEPWWSSLFSTLFRGPMDCGYGIGCPTSPLPRWPLAPLHHSASMDLGACTGPLLCAVVVGAIPSFVSFASTQLSLEHHVRKDTHCKHLDGPLGRSIQSWRARKVHSCRAAHTSTRASAFTLKVMTFNAKSLLEQGKLVFVASRLLELDVDIACFQETRLRDQLLIEAVGEYKICSQAAEPHRGGLMIMHRVKPGIALLEHHCVSLRVLRATFKINGRKLHVIASHAPTEEDTLEAHTQFSDHMQLALSEIAANGLVLFCTDLNAKVKGLDLKMVGANALSTCRYGAVHRLPLLSALDARGFRLVNTHLGSEADLTWRHPNGHLAQIDFLIADSALMEMAQCVTLAEWGLFDLATASDHRAVLATFEFGAKVRSPRHSALPRFTSDAHYLDFVERCKQRPFVHWDGVQDPAEYVSALVKEIAADISATKPKKAPRKPWIAPRTWNLMIILNRYRRLLTALHQDDRERASIIAREIVAHEGENFFPHDDRDVGPVDGCTAAIKVLSQVTRRMLRADRRAWVDQRCADIHVLHQRNDMRGFHQEIKRLSKSGGKRAGQVLLNPVGVAVSDKDAVGKIWMDHWKHHFDATEVPAVSFEDRATLIYDDPSITDGALLAHRHSNEAEDLADSHHGSDADGDLVQFTAQDVQNVIARMPARKATPDLIPSEAWKLVAEQTSPALAAMFNLYIRHKCVPASFAGSRIVSVWKKKGSVLSPGSYRPIALMKTESKLMSRLILSQLTLRLKHHSAQFGSGHSTGTLFPQVVVRQLSAAAHTAGLASATLFVDICAAFDKVLKPLLWGSSSLDATAPDFEALGHTASQSQMLYEYLASHPSVLAMCGLPASIISVLRVWGTNAWFCTQISSNCEVDTACRTTSGVRQGDNISAIVFDIFYGVIIDELLRELRTANLLVSLPCPVGRTFNLVARHGARPHNIELGPVAYRDDLALSIWGASNQELLEKIIHASAIVQRVHSLFHLTVNFSASKTEVTVELTKPDAKAHWQGMRLVGRARGSKRPVIALEDGVSLTVASTYPHLGCIHAQNLIRLAW